MKPYIRTLLVWFLSLSLSGLPLIAQAQDIAGIALPDVPMTMAPQAVQVVAKPMSQHNSDEMPCHAQAKVSVPASAPDLVKNTTQPASKKCCCEGDCQCSHDMGCQTGHHAASVAILLPARLVSSSIHSFLVKEITALYHDCDADAEIIPPIV